MIGDLLFVTGVKTAVASVAAYAAVSVLAIIQHIGGWHIDERPAAVAIVFFLIGLALIGVGRLINAMGNRP